jgi:signal peptidase
MRILAAATGWLRRIVDVALIVVVLVVLFGIVLGKVVPLTGRQTIAIGGASMEPAIPLGSATVIAPVDPATLAPGDVVSMRITEANAIFTHRIVEIVDRSDGRWIRTKGDANPDPDPTLVPASAIIGRVEVAIPLMGYLLALLSIPVGVVFVVGVGATLLAVAWLLESLEPAPRTGSRSARAGADLEDAVPGQPRTVVAPPPMLIPAITGGMVLRIVAPGTRTPLLLDPASLPRPNAREQIARSRDLRNRRVRWGMRNRKPGSIR